MAEWRKSAISATGLPFLWGDKTPNDAFVRSSIRTRQAMHYETEGACRQSGQENQRLRIWERYAASLIKSKEHVRHSEGIDNPVHPIIATAILRAFIGRFLGNRRLHIGGRRS